MSKRTSIELTNSMVANSGGVGDNDYDDLFREKEDTGEKGNINIPRPAKRMDIPSHCPGLGGCGDNDGRREAIVFIEGGGEWQQPTSLAALGGGSFGWRQKRWECFALIAIG
jgi:hypothetical protein